MSRKRKPRVTQPVQQGPVVPVVAQPETARGVYSNVALIHHTKNEFIIDFLLQYGGEAQMVSRVILSPQHMRALSKALDDNIRKFNAKFGSARQRAGRA